jgi:Zn-dependent M28 family amino/carboxypeptidase
MWIRQRIEQQPEPVRAPRLIPRRTALERWVERLAIPRHRVLNAKGNRWVRHELVAAFEQLGFSVQLQGEYDNVVALPARGDGSPLTLVAAHYDSVPQSPGADDNASGLAAMLECARLCVEMDRKLPIGFIAFNAEEDGLLGSQDFVNRGLPTLSRAVRLVHVLEMVGFRARGALQCWPLPWVPAALRAPDFIALIAAGAANPLVDVAVRSAAAPGLRVLGAKTWRPAHRLLPDLTRSDHSPFWRANVAATMWTDTANFRNPNYHRPSDTPDTLDYDFLRDVTELVCSLVLRDHVASCVRNEGGS